MKGQSIKAKSIEDPEVIIDNVPQPTISVTEGTILKDKTPVKISINKEGYMVWEKLYSRLRDMFR